MARRPIVRETRIEVRTFEKAAPLVTLDEFSFAYWGEQAAFAPHPNQNVEGAYVRAQPPDGMTEESVESARRRLRAAGALAVRVLPRAKQGAAPVPEPAEASRTPREVVLELVEEVPSRDRERLRRVIEEVMGEAGI